MNTVNATSIRAAVCMFGIAGVAWTPSAHAEELGPPTADVTSDVPAITLPKALAYAHEHQPAIRAALARITAEKAAAEVPRGQWLPLVGAAAELMGATSNNTTASYLPSWDVDIPRIGGSQGTSWSGTCTGGTACPHPTAQPYASTFVAASLTQELFDFGRIAAQAAAADAQIEAAQRASDAERIAIDFSVEEAYFAIFAARGVYGAAEGAFQRSKAHRDLARAGVSSGLRSPIQLTRAEAELARVEVSRIRARGNVALAQTVLAAAMGSTEAAYDVSGPPPTFPELPSMREVIKKASERDPRIQEALARLAAQQKTTTAIAAELRPNLLGSLTVSSRAGGDAATNGAVPPGDGWAPDVPNWDAAVVLSWPIFDGVVTARKHASRAREDVLREEVALERDRELADIERTYVRFEQARVALPALQRAVDGALANYAQADARFKSGLGDQVELADAEAIREEAEVQLALGRFEVARARADFGRAIAEGM